jgi:hypothetical protein
MNRKRLIPISSNPTSRALIALSCLITICVKNSQADTPVKQGFQSFKMLQTRNIFDPQRQPLSQPTPHQRTSTPRPDTAALTGTMVTADKKLAFFSGSRADYNKVLGEKGQIAQGTITHITETDVEIERDGKRVVVSIGQSLPLKDEAIVTDGSVKPEAASQFESASAASNSGSTTASSSSSPTTDSSSNSSAASDVLKRMMQRRQQEMSK